jgi:hypothetical protein
MCPVFFPFRAPQYRYKLGSETADCKTNSTGTSLGDGRSDDGVHENSDAQ